MYTLLIFRCYFAKLNNTLKKDNLVKYCKKFDIPYRFR